MQGFFCKKFEKFCLFHTGKENFDRGIRHSSGFTSTSTISGPMRQIQFQGMRKSSRCPHRPKCRQGPGTIMAVIFPSGSSIRASDTKPSRRPSHTQMTSLQCRSVNFVIANPQKSSICICYAFQRAVMRQLMLLRIVPRALFSSRETWAWEMPTRPATSIWVFPPTKRKLRICFSRLPKA